MTILYEKIFQNQRGKNFYIRNDDPIFEKFVIYNRRGYLRAADGELAHGSWLIADGKVQGIRKRV